jgi:prepilin-type N-terminal cleavage/methylation domain-containing protein
MDGTQVMGAKRKIQNVKRKYGVGGFLSQAGVTLVEVLVSVVVLSIGLLGIAMMQYMAIGGNAFGREMQVATELGQELLEQAKSTSYADPNLDSGFHSETLTSPDPQRFGGITFNRAWWVLDSCRNQNVALDPNDPCDSASASTCTDSQGDMKTIVVRVCWVDKNGGNHSASLSGIKWDEEATP